MGNICRTSLVSLTINAAWLPAMGQTTCPTIAQRNWSCDTTYIGPTNKSWHRPLSWDPVVPDRTLRACVPPNKFATVHRKSCQLGTEHGSACADDTDCPGGACVTNPDAQCAALYIQRDTNGHGRVDVYDGVNLVLNGDPNYKTTVDGDLYVVYQGELRIGSNMTIDGCGGELCGYTLGLPGATPLGRITSGNICSTTGLQCTGPGDCPAPGVCDTSEKTLTVQGYNNSPPFDPTQPDTRLSLKVHDEIDIDLPLVNNGYVVADRKTLRINRASSGNGFWRAEKLVTVDPGILQINAVVTGSGTWQLIEDAEAQIVFNAASTGLTGNFKITKGKLVLNQNFQTTGNLEMISESGTVPEINIAIGKTVYFAWQ